MKGRPCRLLPECSWHQKGGRTNIVCKPEHKDLNAPRVPGEWVAIGTSRDSPEPRRMLGMRDVGRRRGDQRMPIHHRRLGEMSPEDTNKL